MKILLDAVLPEDGLGRVLRQYGAGIASQVVHHCAPDKGTRQHIIFGLASRFETERSGFGTSRPVGYLKYTLDKQGDSISVDVFTQSRKTGEHIDDTRFGAESTIMSLYRSTWPQYRHRTRPVAIDSIDDE